jgi:hypothetical protein
MHWLFHAEKTGEIEPLEECFHNFKTVAARANQLERQRLRFFIRGTVLHSVVAILQWCWVGP